jgi:hypothetical protein
MGSPMSITTQKSPFLSSSSLSYSTPLFPPPLSLSFSVQSPNRPSTRRLLPSLSPPLPPPPASLSLAVACFPLSRRRLLLPLASLSLPPSPPSPAAAPESSARGGGGSRRRLVAGAADPGRRRQLYSSSSSSGGRSPLSPSLSLSPVEGGGEDPGGGRSGATVAGSGPPADGAASAPPHEDGGGAGGSCIDDGAALAAATSLLALPSCRRHRSPLSPAVAAHRPLSHAKSGCSSSSHRSLHRRLGRDAATLGRAREVAARQEGNSGGGTAPTSSQHVATPLPSPVTADG